MNYLSVKRKREKEDSLEALATEPQNGDAADQLSQNPPLHYNKRRRSISEVIDEYARDAQVQSNRRRSSNRLSALNPGSIENLKHELELREAECRKLKRDLNIEEELHRQQVDKKLYEQSQRRELVKLLDIKESHIQKLTECLAKHQKIHAEASDVEDETAVSDLDSTQKEYAERMDEICTRAQHADVCHLRGQTNTIDISDEHEDHENADRGELQKEMQETSRELAVIAGSVLKLYRKKKATDEKVLTMRQASDNSSTSLLSLQEKVKALEADKNALEAEKESLKEALQQKEQQFSRLRVIIGL